MNETSSAFMQPKGSAARLDVACLGAGSAHKGRDLLSVTAGMAGWIRGWTAMPNAAVGLVESTTAAVDAALMALAPGVRSIGVTSAAHPTMRRAAEQAARMIGRLGGGSPRLAEFDLCSIPRRSADEFADQFVSLAAGQLAGAPGILILEQVTSVHGLRLPIERICRSLRQTCPDLRLVIDGAQAVGLWPLAPDLADAFAGCFHKFAGGQPGTAFLALDPAWAAGLPSHLAVQAELPGAVQALPTIDLQKWAGILARLETDGSSWGTPELVGRIEAFNASLRAAMLPVNTTLGADVDPSLRSHISAVRATNSNHACQIVDALARGGFAVQAFESLVRIAPGPDALPIWGGRVGDILRTQLVNGSEAVGLESTATR